MSIWRDSEGKRSVSSGLNFYTCCERADGVTGLDYLRYLGRHIKRRTSIKDLNTQGSVKRKIVEAHIQLDKGSSAILNNDSELINYVMAFGHEGLVCFLQKDGKYKLRKRA